MILPVASTKLTSGFEVDLGAAVLADRLQVNGIPAPFLKRFRLEGSGDRSRWTLLVGEGTLFDLPDESLRMTEAWFTAGEYRYLRITWSDRESGRVPLPASAAARLVESRQGAAPLRAPVEFRRLSSVPGRSRFQIRLPGPHLPLAAVELSVKENHLSRPARITESRFSGGELIPVTLGEASLRKTVRTGVVASDLRIPIRAPDGREIELSVEDQSNMPLELGAVTLEFVPQPWIYLESAGETLTARYGHPQLKAPKYDLEAARQNVGKVALHEARWEQPRDREPQITAAGGGWELPPGAVVDTKKLRVARPIPAAPAGLSALLLDAAVLAHARPDLGDLRITDSASRQIPYLLERREDPLILPLAPLVPGPSQGRQSRYQIQLPFAHLPESRLALTTPERVFQRTVYVEAARLGRPRGRGSEPTRVAIAEWRHADPELPAPRLTLRLPPLSASVITLVVEEGDNRALPLDPPRLELPGYRLRFYHPGGAPLTLRYGQHDLAAPRYDLALLAPRLVGLPAQELALATPGAALPPESARQSRIFWTALIAAVLVLLAFLARLLKAETPAAP